jgi:hypothetical protein
MKEEKLLILLKSFFDTLPKWIDNPTSQGLKRYMENENKQPARRYLSISVGQRPKAEIYE